MAKFDPDKHHRRSVRLKGYDYADDGAYFVTICTHQRACLFGDIVDGEMLLNTLGCIVAEEWERTAQVRAYVMLDQYIVMPNHLHGIVVINRGWGNTDQNDVSHTDTVGTRRRRVPTDTPQKSAFGKTIPHSLAAIIAQFKSITTKRIRKTLGTPTPIWQRNYYEHIIHAEDELNGVRQYITGNPMRWAEDENYIA